MQTLSEKLTQKVRQANETADEEPTPIEQEHDLFDDDTEVENAV